MKILVTGGSGFVGYHLCRRLVLCGLEVEYTYLSHECALQGAAGHHVDVSDKRSMGKLSSNSYDAIIHTAALANVDLCEKDPQLARLQNVAGTANAISLAEKTGAKLAYLSTSHVFPPSKKAYTEEDEPSPELISGVYAKTKLEGEGLVRASGLPHLILRIDQPYYWRAQWQKDNTVTRTIARLSRKEKPTEVADWFNCPTFVPSFCELVHSLLSSGKEGVFHATGPDYLSRYEWGQKIAAAFGFPQSEILPIHSSSLHLPVQRPNVRLDSSRAYASAGVKNASVEEGLRQMASEYKQGSAGKMDEK